jgi:hypothetical protein
VTVATALPLRLNHVETVYRAGDHDAAQAAFELLGFLVTESASGCMYAVLDPVAGNGIDNAIYATEVTAEQWALEEALQDALSGSSALGTAVATYREQMSTRPQAVFHFGVAVPTVEAWEALVARVQEGAASHPLLAGRIAVVGVFRPGDPGSLSDQRQAFVHTDVFASGLLAMGQQIELQYTPPQVLEHVGRMLATARSRS